MQGDKWLTGADMAMVAEAHNRRNVDSFVISGDTILEIKVLLAGSLLAVKKREICPTVT